ncbi:MAG: DUF262 domain-containing protein [Lachnospiraceae bacterium]|nr:DUF262 domain-containing protein [Lachnospiraceae bacterium]
MEKFIKDDLDRLIDLAENNNYTINIMTINHLYSGLPHEHKTNEIYDEISDYLAMNEITIINDGDDGDEEVSSDSVKIRPFDPSLIDIKMQTMTVSDLVERIIYGNINMKTKFQRKAGLWSHEKKSQLIESLILNIPLPAFYFDTTDDGCWQIIDGLQRISSLYEIMAIDMVKNDSEMKSDLENGAIDRELFDKEPLKMKGLEYYNDYNCYFNDLPRSLKRRIKGTNIIAYTVKKGTPQEVKYNIFKRLNTGGLELSPQEIRHALNQGFATDLLKELAENEAFIKATCGSIKKERMLDQEFVLRYIAICIYGIEYYDGSIDDYLIKTMVYLNTSDLKQRKIEIVNKFEKVMQAATKIFGRYAFRKMSNDGYRRPINKAIFEAWCYVLYNLEDDGIQYLYNKNVQQWFSDLCDSNNSFIINLKSSDKKAIYDRIESVRNIMEEL